MNIILKGLKYVILDLQDIGLIADDNTNEVFVFDSIQDVKDFIEKNALDESNIQVIRIQPFSKQMI